MKALSKLKSLLNRKMVVEPVEELIRSVPFSGSELAKEGSEFVDFIRERKRRKEGLHKSDIADVFKHFSELKLRDGYAIGAYCIVDFYGGCTHPYVHRSDAAIEYKPVENFDNWNCRSSEYEMLGSKYRERPAVRPYEDSMLIMKNLEYWMAKSIPDYQEYVKVPWNELGIWQAFLFWDYAPTLELFWHGGYMVDYYVFSNDVLEKLAGKPRYEEVSDSLMNMKDNPKLLPHVRIDGDSAIISYAYWNNWAGLVISKVKCEKVGNGAKFSRMKDLNEKLVEYDCGIRF